MSADEPLKQASAAPAPLRSERPGGASSLVGRVLSGRYRIERLLGEGGMGAVYQAEHTHMRKRLAVKVLHAEMSRLSEVVQRFEREAMAAAHIDHPNVAAATDFGKLEDGSFFLVMEFLEGKSLRDLINEGRLELGRALHILRQIAAGLTRAHALGIVHRDLKPENVMLVEREGEGDFVKVLDFGIAKVPVGEIAAQRDDRAAQGGQALTQLGMVYGTPEYMAPEQALGQEVDPRADVYAMGVMGFEMLTGSRPYDHDSKVALLGMHVTAPIPTPSERCPQANIPPEVDAIIRRLLAKEASERFQDSKEAMDAVSSALAALASQGRVDPRYAGGGGPPASMQLPPSAPLGTARTGSSAAIPFRPTEQLPSVSMPTKLPLPPRALAGIAAGVVALVALVAIVMGAGSSSGAKAPRVDGGAIASAMPTTSIPTAVPTTPTNPAMEARIVRALALVDKGDYVAGIMELSELEKTNEGRTDIHRALVDAYMAEKRYADAMDEAQRTLEIDPGFSRDRQLQIHVRNAAVSNAKDAEDKAYKLLESRMGTDGPDVLYDIAYLIKENARGQQRARAALKKADTRARQSEELKLALEIRGASERSVCDIRKMLDRAADVGDFRTAALLKTYTATSGCGFLGRRDCWPCLHGDGSLGKAIHAIEDRSKGKP